MMVRAPDRGWRVGFDRCDAVTMMVRASDGGWRVGFDRYDAMTRMTQMTQLR